jgi:O-antigen/teichoic acid export membrane protein
MQLLAHIKNLTKHSFIYTISTIIQRAQGLVLLPILTDTTYLTSTGEYGDYALIYTFIAFMNVVYLYGIDSAFMRYYFLGRHTREQVYTSAIRILSMTALVTSILIYGFAEYIAILIFKSPDYGFFVQVASGILFIDTLCNLPYLILRAEERSILYSGLRIGRFIVELLLNVLFIVYFNLGVKGILYANLIAASINLIALVPFQIKYLKGAFSKDAIKDLLRFGIPMIPNGIAYLVVEMSDRYVMLYLLTKDTVGLYSANHKFGTLMLLVVSAFRTAWQPFFLNIARDENAKQVYSRVMSYFTALAALIVLSGGYLVEYIVQIPVAPNKTLLGSAYWSGTYIIPLVLLSYMFYGIYVNLTVGIYIEKKTKWMGMFTGLAAVTNIACNLILMPIYGMMGAAISAVLAYFVMMLSIYIVTKRIYPIQYEYHILAGIYLYLFAGLFAFYFFDMNLIVKLIIIFGFILVMLSYSSIRSDVTQTIRRIKR